MPRARTRCAHTPIHDMFSAVVSVIDTVVVIVVVLVNVIATLNVIDGARVLFVSAAEADQRQRFSWPVGSYIPLHATAAGKVAAAIALPIDGPPPGPAAARARAGAVGS